MLSKRYMQLTLVTYTLSSIRFSGCSLWLHKLYNVCVLIVLQTLFCFRGCYLRLPRVPFDVCRFEIVEGPRLLARRERDLLLPNVFTGTFVIDYNIVTIARTVVLLCQHSTSERMILIAFSCCSCTAIQDLQTDQETYPSPAPWPRVRMRILQQFVQQPF